MYSPACVPSQVTFRSGLGVRPHTSSGPRHGMDMKPTLHLRIHPEGDGQTPRHLSDHGTVHLGSTNFPAGQTGPAPSHWPSSHINKKTPRVRPRGHPFFAKQGITKPRQFTRAGDLAPPLHVVVTNLDELQTTPGKHGGTTPIQGPVSICRRTRARPSRSEPSYVKAQQQFPSVYYFRPLRRC